MRTGKFTVIFFIFLSIVVSGCEKDKADGAKLLAGKWNQLSTQRIDYTDNVKQNETTITYDAGKLVLEIVGVIN